MNMESDFHMAKGEGETSYVNNSRIQQKALLETEVVLEKAVREVLCMDLHQPAMTAVDLGCSSGQNTLFFVSKVIKVAGHDSDEKSRCNPVELQFFLNDLPGNNFNHVFRSLERFKESITARHKGNTLLPPFYIAGLPGSYYTRLFPRQSCHLFHSSFCLHWRSRVPAGLEEGGREYLNEGNIYIANTTPAGVAELYRRQFQNDMLLFLKLRYEELVFGGQMVLTFLGRKYEDIYNDGHLNHPWGLLARSLQSLVEEGLVNKEKLDSFNLPIYTPSINEVKAVIGQSELFNVSHITLFDSNWDPHDDSQGDDAHNTIQSAINIAKSLRAVFGPLLASHFGESLLNEIFKKCAYYVTEHLAERGEGKYLLICLSLKRT
ncbi:anthranilate O-methyltransferase 1-like isoform X1 [Triticum dicoccoides]|uniref:anthranilate O-methyltransferase 1-like isoform X1 n=1 Tax=Triticum dicoccoides TaxID=85692 RepID=UPI001233CE43|nr:anthranilate O-methyltransferase 1-like isoform X1 [Triticum dicoccoides]